MNNAYLHYTGKGFINAPIYRKTDKSVSRVFVSLKFGSKYYFTENDILTPETIETYKQLTRINLQFHQDSDEESSIITESSDEKTEEIAQEKIEQPISDADKSEISAQLEITFSRDSLKSFASENNIEYTSRISTPNLISKLIEEIPEQCLELLNKSQEEI